jgi:Flp pilus assembly protein TadD
MNRDITGQMKSKGIKNSQTSAARSDDNDAFWMSMTMFVVVVAAFFPLTQGGFINYDDDIYVTGNYQVQSGVGLKQLGWAFSSTEGGNWHPLTWISHMLDCQFYGMKPWGHHLTSVLIHALNAVLLFRVMRVMTRATWRSAAVALLFGLHPLRVESVAWISERKDVLCGTFWLLTMWAYAVYARELKIKNAKCKIYYGLALVFFVFALMSKPMAVSLPFVLLLVDWWPLARICDLRIANYDLPKSEKTRFPQIPLRRALMEKWPFFLLAATGCVVTYLAQKGKGAVIEFLPLSDRVGNALIGYCRYLGKFFWPTKLAVLYPYPAEQWPLGWVAMAGTTLVAISVLMFAWRRTRPYGLMGWLWFVGTLVPVIGLVQVGSQSIADRYTYLPAIGLNIIAVWGVWELAQRWRVRKTEITAGAAAVGIVCVAVTEHQIAFWRDGGKLFSHAVAVTDNSFEARKALGDFYWSQGNAPEAERLYHEALEIYPKFEGAHLNLGVVFSQTGRATEAEKEFAQATVLDPRDASAINDLGTVVAARNVDEALALFKKATELDPNYADARKNLGVALDTKRSWAEAAEEYRRVTELRPDADAHYLRGMDLGRLGRFVEAAKEFEAALKLQPNHHNAHLALERIKGANAK